VNTTFPRGYRSVGSIYCGSSRNLQGLPYFRGSIDVAGRLAWTCSCVGGHYCAEFATQCAETKHAELAAQGL
jgi:hypothetical protein